MSSIRPCGDDERTAILEIVNAAAAAYRGVIPEDRWHEPYMDSRELEDEIAGGVAFWGYEAEGEMVGVMGIQPVRDVVLIRHAYVRPERQGEGIGRALLDHLRAMTDRRILIGTWAAAEWAIRFYERNGFELVSPERKSELLRTYWSIPDRQIETSVVLACPPDMCSAPPDPRIDDECPRQRPRPLDSAAPRAGEPTDHRDRRAQRHAAAAVRAEAAGVGAPNVVFVLIDNMGFADPSCFGGRSKCRARTPSRAFRAPLTFLVRDRLLADAGGAAHRPQLAQREHGRVPGWARGFRWSSPDFDCAARRGPRFKATEPPCSASALSCRRGS